jgi:hypothetical protein
MSKADEGHGRCKVRMFPVISKPAALKSEVPKSEIRRKSEIFDPKKGSKRV